MKRGLDCVDRKDVVLWQSLNVLAIAGMKSSNRSHAGELDWLVRYSTAGRRVACR
jgi:hypothetical protein